jgi:hypothetical protein
MSRGIGQSSERRSLAYPCKPALHEAMAADRSILERLAAGPESAHPHSLTRDRRAVARPAIACTGGFSPCMRP